MDVRTMLKTLDSLYAQGNLKEADNLLNRELEEALVSGHDAAVLTIYNEMEGLYRTTGRAKTAAEISEKALDLIAQMGLKNTIHHGTTLLNGATANRAAGNLDRALFMYQEAAKIFETLGQSTGYQMASLYNNISHIYQAKGEHEAALVSLEKALELISVMADNAAELATTRVSLANSWMALGKTEKAEEFLSLALSYYESPEGQTDGHYGSALASAGELAWRKGEHDAAVSHMENALEVIKQRFGENDACRVIRENLKLIRQEK